MRKNILIYFHTANKDFPKVLQIVKSEVGTFLFVSACFIGWVLLSIKKTLTNWKLIV